MSVNINPNTNFTIMPMPTQPTSPQSLNPTSLFSPNGIDDSNLQNPSGSQNTTPKAKDYASDFMSILRGIFSGDSAAVSQGMNSIMDKEQQRLDKLEQEQKKEKGMQDVKFATPQSKSDAAARLGDASDFWDNNPNPDKNVVTLDYVKEVANSNPNDGKYSAETIAAAKYVSQSESTKADLDGATTKEGPLSQDKQYGKWDFQKVAAEKPAAPEESLAPQDASEAATTLRNATDLWDNIPNEDDKNNGLLTYDYLKEVAGSKPEDGKFTAKTIAAAKYTLDNQYALDKFDKGNWEDRGMDRRISKEDLEYNMGDREHKDMSA